MPRKQMSEEQERAAIELIHREFPELDLQHIYSVLQQQKFDGIFVMIGQRIGGVKPTIVRQFLLDSYMRVAFKNSFKEAVIEVDRYVLDFLTQNFNAFAATDLKNRHAFVRELIRERFHQPDEHGLYRMHFDQIYDHVMNFLRVDGKLITSADQLQLIGKKTTQKAGVKLPVKKAEVFQIQDAVKPATDTNEHKEKETFKSLNEQFEDEEEPEFEVSECHAVYRVVDKMNVQDVVLQIKKMLEIYYDIQQEEQRLMKKLNEYGKKFKGYLQDFRK